MRQLHARAQRHLPQVRHLRRDQRVQLSFAGELASPDAAFEATMEHDRFLIEETDDGRFSIAEHSIIDPQSKATGGYNIVALLNSEEEALAAVQGLGQSENERLAKNHGRSFADWLKHG